MNEWDPERERDPYERLMDELVKKAKDLQLPDFRPRLPTTEEVAAMRAAFRADWISSLARDLVIEGVDVLAAVSRAAELWEQLHAVKAQPWPNWQIMGGSQR